MAYNGRIAFLEIPFAGVEWTGNVCGPSGSEFDWDRRLQAKASNLRIDGVQLTEMAVLDVQGEEFVEDSWKCVLVGRKVQGAEVHNAAHYVLLIRPIPCSSQPGDFYERIGVAELLASHLSVETTPVFIV